MGGLLSFRDLKNLPTLERNVYWVVQIKFPNENDFVEFIATSVELGDLKFLSDKALKVSGLPITMVGIRDYPEIVVSFLDTDDLKFRKLFKKYFEYVYDEFGRMRVLKEAVVDVVVKMYNSRKDLIEEGRFQAVIDGSVVNWKGVSKPQFIEKEVRFAVVGW